MLTTSQYGGNVMISVSHSAWLLLPHPVRHGGSAHNL